MDDSKEIGFHFGRADLDRVGLFAEMSYMNGKGYQPPLEVVPLDRSKSLAFTAPVPKWKVGLQDCYFDTEFKRIFTKEAYSNPLQQYRKEQLLSKKKNVSPAPFNSTFAMKHSSTPGDFYGTFEENIIPAMSPLTRPQKRVPEKPNFLGFVPKKGNGGYVDICMNKYPERIARVDKYDAARELYKKGFAEHKKNMKGAPFAVPKKCAYFDENPYKTDKIIKTYKEVKEKPYRRGPVFVIPGPGKKLGGNKSGCFDKYPPHSNDKYLSEKQIEKELLKKMVKPTRDSGIMRPAGIPKRWRIQSEIPYNMQFRVHAKNWRCAEPFVYFKPC